MPQEIYKKKKKEFKAPCAQQSFLLQQQRKKKKKKRNHRIATHTHTHKKKTLLFWCYKFQPVYVQTKKEDKVDEKNKKGRKHSNKPGLGKLGTTRILVLMS